MNIALTSVAFLVAILCAGAMGFAIQRGATCTVAALDEAVNQRRFQRLLSMMEASLWVVGGLAIARAFGTLLATPAGFPVSLSTVVGGVLLGIGAFVNRACVFGAIARLGSGEWAYVVTPFGFYLGCASLPYLHVASPPQQFSYGSPVLQAPSVVALLFIAFVILRLAQAARAGEQDPASPALRVRLRYALTAHVWSPHVATIVIGIAFFIMLVLVGAWAYTDVLAELARGMSGNLGAGGLLLAALFAGAVTGGWSTGRFRQYGVTLAPLLRCLLGGCLM